MPKAGIRSGRQPHTWDISLSALTDIPLINYEAENCLETGSLPADFLSAPLLPMELTSDGDAEYLILYTGRTFYYCPKNNPVFLDTILSYVEKSRFRKILCYEPYQLYDYFYRQQVYGINLFSLRLAMDITHPSDLWERNPWESLQAVTHNKSADPAPAIISCMKNCIPAFYILEQQLASQDNTKVAHHQEIMYLSQLLGYSYKIKKLLPCPELPVS